MVQWDDIKILMHFAKSKTMQNASYAAKSNVSTISRKLERLNTALAVPALKKVGRNWELTPFGEDLSNAAIDFQMAIDQADAVHTKQQLGIGPDRDITIVVADPVMTRLIGKNIAEFRKIFPSAHLNLVVDAAHKSMMDGRADIALFMDRPQKGTFICRRVGLIRTGFFCKSGQKPKNWVGLCRDLDSSPAMQAATKYFGHGAECLMGDFSGIKQAIQDTGWAGYGCEFVFPAQEGFEMVDPKELVFLREFWMAYDESRKNDVIIRGICDWIAAIFHRDCHSMVDQNYAATLSDTIAAQ